MRTCNCGHLEMRSAIIRSAESKLSGAGLRRSISLSALPLPQSEETMSTNYPQVGGYPQNPQYPQYTPPAYRLYDVGAVALAAFLGSPLAGTVLIASNYRKLGQGGNGFLALLLGAAASAAEIYIGFTSAKSPAIATLVLFAITWFAAM